MEGYAIHNYLLIFIYRYSIMELKTSHFIDISNIYTKINGPTFASIQQGFFFLTKKEQT